MAADPIPPTAFDPRLPGAAYSPADFYNAWLSSLRAADMLGPGGKFEGQTVGFHPQRNVGITDPVSHQQLISSLLPPGTLPLPEMTSTTGPSLAGMELAGKGLDKLGLPLTQTRDIGPPAQEFEANALFQGPDGNFWTKGPDGKFVLVNPGLDLTPLEQKQLNTFTKTFAGSQPQSNDALDPLTLAENSAMVASFLLSGPIAGSVAPVLGEIGGQLVGQKLGGAEGQQIGGAAGGLIGGAVGGGAAEFGGGTGGVDISTQPDLGALTGSAGGTAQSLGQAVQAGLAAGGALSAEGGVSGGVGKSGGAAGGGPGPGPGSTGDVSSPQVSGGAAGGAQSPGASSLGTGALDNTSLAQPSVSSVSANAPAAAASLPSSAAGAGPSLGVQDIARDVFKAINLAQTGQTISSLASGPSGGGGQSVSGTPPVTQAPPGGEGPPATPPDITSAPAGGGAAPVIPSTQQTGNAPPGSALSTPITGPAAAPPPLNTGPFQGTIDSFTQSADTAIRSQMATMGLNPDSPMAQTLIRRATVDIQQRAADIEAAMSTVGASNPQVFNQLMNSGVTGQQNFIQMLGQLKAA